MTWRMVGKRRVRAAGEGGRASFASRCTLIYDRGLVSALDIFVSSYSNLDYNGSYR